MWRCSDWGMCMGLGYVYEVMHNMIACGIECAMCTKAYMTGVVYERTV